METEDHAVDGVPLAVGLAGGCSAIEEEVEIRHEEGLAVVVEVDEPVVLCKGHGSADGLEGR